MKFWKKCLKYMDEYSLELLLVSSVIAMGMLMMYYLGAVIGKLITRIAYM